MFSLRPYQQKAVDELRQTIRLGTRRVVLVSPTGSGKTVIASSMIASALAGGRKVLFIAHRKELIDQCSRKLAACEIAHGIIMAGHKMNAEPVQVASIQTAVRRDLSAFAFDLIIIDECHHAASDSYQKIVALFPDAVVVGLTATPFRSDGRGLGSMFSGFVRVASVRELTAAGFLVPAKYWAPSAPDMTGVKKVAGDFDQEETADRMNKPHLVGNVVDHYLKIANGKRAICFAVNVAHSLALTNAFLDAGVPVCHLDADTDKRDREAILAALHAGEISVVSNCGILSEGYDDPAVEVCIQARPTASASLHLQQIGRVLRPAPEKRFALVLDHAGNVLRHGFADEEFDVDLREGISKSRQANGPALRTCPDCYAIMASGTLKCIACGRELKPEPRKVSTRRGSLTELLTCKYCGAEGQIEKRPHEQHGTGIWCSACGRHLFWLGKNVAPTDYLKKQLDLCREKGWKPGRAAVLFKNRFGHWPTKADWAALPKEAGL